MTYNSSGWRMAQGSGDLQDSTGTTVTATAEEINQTCDKSASHEVVAATNVITAAESGKTFFLAAAAGFTSTLPAPAVGLRYKFIVSTAPTSNGYTIATNGGANIIKGLVTENEVDSGEDGPADDNADALLFVHNVALAGDWVELVSDGTSWFVHGQVRADGALTMSTT